MGLILKIVLVVRTSAFAAGVLSIDGRRLLGICMDRWRRRVRAGGFVPFAIRGLIGPVGLCSIARAVVVRSRVKQNIGVVRGNLFFKYDIEKHVGYLCIIIYNSNMPLHLH